MPVSSVSVDVCGRLWLRADWLGEREPFPLLWLHLSDGRILAFQLPPAREGDDSIIDPLVAQVFDDWRGTTLSIDCADVKAAPLYAAPAAPMPRLSWGDPRHAQARAFATGLDQEVLCLLASLNTHRYWDSLRNYNRIAAQPSQVRERRLQALTRFPVLVAPVLLSAHHSLRAEGGKRHAWRAHDDAVMAAVEQGRDLAGTLARHYGISKSLVRAPICSVMWGSTALAHPRLLHLLDGIPAHRRPTSVADFELAMPLFINLNQDADDRFDFHVIGRTAFARGLTAVCMPMHARFAPLGTAFADCRDFAEAALDWAAQADVYPHGLSAKRLQLLWIQVRGFQSLLAASQRWHERIPQQHDPEIEPRDETRLLSLLGEYFEDAARARECCTQGELIREGEAMHHCVALYWPKCRDQGTRIVALHERNDRATAEYDFDLARLAFRLDQLRGPRNAEPSQAMTDFANRVETVLNALERAPARVRLAEPSL